MVELVSISRLKFVTMYCNKEVIMFILGSLLGVTEVFSEVTVLDCLTCFML